MRHNVAGPFCKLNFGYGFFYKDCSIFQIVSQRIVNKNHSYFDCSLLITAFRLRGLHQQTRKSGPVSVSLWMAERVSEVEWLEGRNRKYWRKEAVPILKDSGLIEPNFLTSALGLLGDLAPIPGNDRCRLHCGQSPELHVIVNEPLANKHHFAN